MKRIVLIDGENLVYGLRTLLSTKAIRANRSLVSNFNFRKMLEELLADNPPTEILWYGARLRLYNKNSAIKLKSEAAIRDQSRFVNLIKQQKIDFIKVGYLRARETEPCEKCAHQSWRLAEKGVDVGLAVKMVAESRSGVEIVVVSADTDLLPAFQESKKKGAKLMHIGYEHRPIAALSQASHTTRTITLPIAQKYSRAK